MTAPLRPVVVGPIYAVPDVRVQVDNVLPDSLVQVLRNDIEVARATSGSTAGTISVLVTVPLAVNDQITAAQAYTGSDDHIPVTPGVLSQPSPFAVTVLAVPAQLPTPVFQSLVNHCSSGVVLGHLIPGAFVTITEDIPGAGSTLIATGTAQYPTQEFSLTGPEPSPGQQLQAIQGFGDNVSPVGLSARVAPKPASLPQPVAATPLLACQTTMDMSSLVPGAELAVINGEIVQGGTIRAASCTADLTQPLKEGPLTVHQYFERCTDVPPSPLGSYNVTSQYPPARSRATACARNSASCWCATCCRTRCSR